MNFGRLPSKSTLFTHLGSTALDHVSGAGPAGRCYVPLSGLLHVCAYLYETGAILGRARRDRISELIAMSFDTHEREICLAELRRLLRRRLERSGRYAHSFYTFYLHGTMRDMNLYFDINSIREAHNDIRLKSEVWHFMEYAGAEGLLLGGWYPDLVGKMYGKGYGEQEHIINEITRGIVLLPEGTSIMSIREREKVILNKVSAFISQYNLKRTNTPGVMTDGEYGFKGKRPIREPEQPTEAYLDIETTGLTPSGCDITVVGIHICSNGDSRFVQLVGKDINSQSILEALQGVTFLYTYNGSRFDLPFIHQSLGVNLAEVCTHIDLMYHCWRKNLYGGLKSVEHKLGIQRSLTGINGYEAVKLWWRYVDSFDLDALNMLLQYNKEDVINLKAVRDRIF